MKVYLAWHVYTYEYEYLIGVYSNEEDAVKSVEEYLSENHNSSGYLLNNKRSDTLDIGLHLWSDKDEGDGPFEYAKVDEWDVE
jgi:hypothetical protein